MTSPPARRRRKLTREKIVETSLHLVRREGVDALNMRRLGRELEVDASAIYWHFDGKKDLMAAVLARNSENIELEPPPPGPWRDRCRSLGRAIRQRIRENAEIATSADAVAGLASFNMRSNGLMIRVLWDGGFSGPDAILASQALVSVAIKFAEIELAAEDKMPSPEAIREVAQAAAASESGETAEKMLEMANAYSGLTVRDLFDYALERMLDGVEAGHR